MTHPIFGIAISLCLGIVSARFFNLKVSLFTLSFLSFLLILISIFFAPRRFLFWFFLFFGIFLLGQLLYCKKINTIEKTIPEETTTLIGIIDSFPISILSGTENTFRVRFRFRCIARINSQNQQEPLNQKILVSAPAPPLSNPISIYRYGDKLVMRGKILQNSAPRNPGSFDPETYLIRENISARFFVRELSEIRLLSNRNGSRLLCMIGELKISLEKMIDEKIPIPERGVVKAILLGSQNEIDFDIRDQFSKSGTAHLLAISGGNVALLASIFIFIFQIFRLPRRISYGLIIILLWIYCILTGTNVSIVRATLMITLYLSGYIFRRESEVINSLSWSAIIILILEPFQIFDPGFQLSFITVLALTTLTSRQQSLELKFLNSHPDSDFLLALDQRYRTWILRSLFYLQNCLSVSFAAWFSIVPLIAYYFFLFSPVTVLANLFVVPYTCGVMVSGFTFMLLGNLNNFFKEILGASLWFLTKGLIFLCKYFSSIPYGYFRVPPPSLTDFIIFYLLILMKMFGHLFNLKKTHFWLIALIFANFYIWKPIFHPSEKKFKMTFLDVGHGDSAVLEFPDKGCIVIDTGSGETIGWNQGRMTIAPFLWSRGITHLDAVLISHPHSDHYGGLSYLLQEFSVGAVFDNGNRNSVLYEQCFKDKKVSRINLKRGDKILGIDGVGMTVLHPSQNILNRSDLGANDQSLVLQIQYQGAMKRSVMNPNSVNTKSGLKILMTGDSEEYALRSLVQYGEKLQSQILKVSHHGSNQKSVGNEFVRLVKPEVAIISESEKNQFNLPSPNTVRFLNQMEAKIYQTGLTGAVEVMSDGTNYNVKTMLKR